MGSAAFEQEREAILGQKVEAAPAIGKAGAVLAFATWGAAAVRGDDMALVARAGDKIGQAALVSKPDASGKRFPVLFDPLVKKDDAWQPFGKKGQSGPRGYVEMYIEKKRAVGILCKLLSARCKVSAIVEADKELLSGVRREKCGNAIEIGLVVKENGHEWDDVPGAQFPQPYEGAGGRRQ